MGRRDIASMLGVAHETVSRSFTALAAARLIHVSDRDVEILDMDGLKAYSRNTRRSVYEPGTPAGRRQALQRRSACTPMGLRPLAA
jgi:CRP/FNR family transcriptional regulator